jgi:hypothetical protein
MEVIGHFHASARLHRGKTSRHPDASRIGSWVALKDGLVVVRKEISYSSSGSNSDSSVIQPVAYCAL